jgi:hypothetical protein
MKKYVVRGGRYGGEVTIGRVSKEFVEYWSPKVEEDGDGDLINHVVNLDYDGADVDPSLPTMTVDGNTAWYEIDDIEHSNGYYADSNFFVTELDEEGNETGDEVEFTNASLYGREAYNETSMPEPTEYLTQEDVDNYVPVLVFHSGEKGAFGQWIIETEEDFDPYKFTFSILETNLGEFVERVWYDGVEIDCDYDWCDSIGKGYYAQVGYMNPKWHDSADKYTDEYLEDEGFWESFNDSVEWEKEQAGKENE